MKIQNGHGRTWFESGRVPKPDHRISDLGQRSSVAKFSKSPKLLYVRFLYFVCIYTDKEVMVIFKFLSNQLLSADVWCAR